MKSENLISSVDKRIEDFLSSMPSVHVPGRTILLEEGHTARFIYFIQKGVMRLWFNNDGKDVTFQFFFENSLVASFDSLHTDAPSLFSLETIEECELVAVPKDDMFRLIERCNHKILL